MLSSQSSTSSYESNGLPCTLYPDWNPHKFVGLMNKRTWWFAGQLWVSYKKLLPTNQGMTEGVKQRQWITEQALAPYLYVSLRHVRITFFLTNNLETGPADPCALWERARDTTSHTPESSATQATQAKDLIRPLPAPSPKIQDRLYNDTGNLVRVAALVRKTGINIWANDE